VSERSRLVIGLAVTAVGLLVALAASWGVHAAEADVVNDLGAEIYTFVPRGWQWAIGFQTVALGGGLLAIAGLTFAFLYDRPMTWARAALGATLFAALMMIIFGIIPNQFLTLTQSTLDWSPQRVFYVLPSGLVLNNEVAISYAALKDMISGGYSLGAFIGVAVFMWWWQGRQKRADQPKPTPVSAYGRPMRVGD
jgi:hypothetical protein